MKDKENILNAKSKKIKKWGCSNLPNRHLQIRREWHEFFIVLRDETINQPRILYPERLSLEMKGVQKQSQINKNYEIYLYQTCSIRNVKGISLN